MPYTCYGMTIVNQICINVPLKELMNRCGAPVASIFLNSRCNVSPLRCPGLANGRADCAAMYAPDAVNHASL